MVKTIIEIFVSAFAVLGIYFSITALLRMWAVKASARMQITLSGDRLPCKLILKTDGENIDNELRVCKKLIECGFFSGVAIDGGEKTDEIIKEVDRMRIRCGREPIEFIENGR